MLCCGGDGERQRLLMRDVGRSDGFRALERFSPWTSDTRADVVLVAPKLDFAKDGEDREKLERIRSARFDTMSRLKVVGLDIKKFSWNEGTEEEPKLVEYVLIGASDSLLKSAAAAIRLEKQLKDEYQPEDLAGKGVVAHEEYEADKHDRFQPDEGGKFFTSLERIRAIFHVMEGPVYALPGCAGIDLDKLVAEGVYDSYFTIQDKVRLEELKSSWIQALPMRKPPVQAIRDYLGEKIALYFAWLHTYTNYLGLLSFFALFPAILGLLASDGETTFEDNALVPVYGVVAIVWAQLFIEHWKRSQNKYQFLWNTEDFEDNEGLRPEFRRRVRRIFQGRNRRLGKPENEGAEEVVEGDGELPEDPSDTSCTDPKTAEMRKGRWTRDGFVPVEREDTVLKQMPRVEYYSERAMRVRLAVSATITVLLIAIILFVSTLILGLRAYIQKYYKPGEEDYPEDAFDYAQYGPMIAGILNAIFIRIMSMIWAYLGLWLNDYEMHRTDTEWEDSYIWKTFAFQFINSYITTLYIGFVQPLQLPMPFLTGKHGEPIRDHCVHNDCFHAIYVQTATLVIFGQVARWLTPMIPAVMVAFRRWRNPGPDYENRVAEAVITQAHLATFTGTYVEYLEMAIQFGFVAMFAVAFPLGSLVCYIANLIEKKSDAAKIALMSRRPKYLGAQDIGSVMGVLELIATLAVVTNSILLYLSCKSYWRYFSPQWASAHPKFWIFLTTIIFEHIVLALKAYVAWSVPDTPRWVEEERARREIRAEVKLRSSKALSDDVKAKLNERMIKMTPKILEDDTLDSESMYV